MSGRYGFGKVILVVAIAAAVGALLGVLAAQLGHHPKSKPAGLSSNFENFKPLPTRSTV